MSNGSAPFRLDWSKASNVEFAMLDEDQTKFMQQTQALVTAESQSKPPTRLSNIYSQKSSFQEFALTVDTTIESRFADLEAKHRYENDLYWTHQLFVQKWKPGSPNIEEEMPA